MTAGMLRPLSIPMWKWEEIVMDLLVGLPKLVRWVNYIWLVVDILTKSAHFILLKSTFIVEHLAKNYIQGIV